MLEGMKRARANKAHSGCVLEAIESIQVVNKAQGGSWLTG